MKPPDQAGTYSTWPASNEYGCTDIGENWKLLDSSMTVFQGEYCQNLCLQEQQDGCCFLNNEHGCYWKGGDYVSNMAGDDAIAVRCSSPG